MKGDLNSMSKTENKSSSENKDTSKRFKKIATPYDRRETWGLILRNAFGIDTKRNKNIVSYIPHKIKLNELTKPKSRLGVVGDIMEMNKFIWIPSNDLKGFFHDCDNLIVNFEATIVESSDKVAKGVIYSAEQRHDENILDSLSNLFSPNKTYLSICNNHAGDFGKEKFLISMKKLKNRGFHVFGTKDDPYVDISEEIRVIGGTKWSNQYCDYIVPLEDTMQYIKQNAFNILYPHWSNELELYPRPETVELGKKYIEKFDVILGHHSHIPQPISLAKHKDFQRIIAYGLGDISTRLKLNKYHYGIALKVEIGLDRQNRFCIGDLEWSFTKCTQLSKTEFQTTLIDKLPYLNK